MGWMSTLSGICIAVGPPLAYGDQYVSILRKHDSRGFSIDISGILIVANITRVFYWLGDRFQTALLIQSFLMIFAQFALLYVCLLYRDTSSGVVDPRSYAETQAIFGGRPSGAASLLQRVVSQRPGQLWQWQHFGSYVEFVALLIVLETSLFLLFHSFDWFVVALGFLALGLEATLPIPQLLFNFQRKSTAGFRHTVLFSWAGGDLIKTIYYYATPNNSVAFKACALFQVSVDAVLVWQTYMYREKTKQDEANNAKDLSGVVGVSGAVQALRVQRGRDEEAAAGASRESESESEDEGDRRPLARN